MARYAATNAITRTMLSELLRREDFQNILRSETLSGAWQALRKTSYRDWVPEEPPSEILGLEKILREVTGSRFKRSLNALRGTPRQVGMLLLSRWDLDNLESALRLWHSKDSGLQKFLTYPGFVDQVAVYDLVEADNLEQVALVLRHTPYFEPVSASLRDYREKKSIFFVEVSLEKDYYRRLLDAVERLGGSDTARARKIIGAEIDMLNLTWLSRLVEYYHIEPAAFHRYAVAGPAEISRKLAHPGLSSEDLKRLRSGVIGALRRQGEELSQLESLALMEEVAQEMAWEAARSSLAGYPFTIGCVFAFYLLKRMELKNLETVFAAKILGSPEDEVWGRVHGLR